MKLRIEIVVLVLFAVLGSMSAQTNKELALTKAKEAIALMNDGKFDESIALLRESEALDTSNYVYPYEIALAFTYKKEHDSAIKILEGVVAEMSTHPEIFQLLGNNYSMSGDSENAVKTYDRGLLINPNSGNLYLEKGNIYMMKEAYDEAVLNYKKGVEVAPEYPSNYYRLAKLYLRSTDKLQGLLYGEIFMNLERTTDRTLDMSKVLFETYKESITFMEDSSSIDFCEIIVDASSLSDEEFKLPFCAMFGKNFILSILNQDTITLSSLSEIRTNFI